jgi:hypothetical protein
LTDTALPAPLVPAEVDLRDFGYMPLDALRLRDSELAIEASPEVFRASVLLWCASWHQVPAGSLPIKDKTLAEYSRAGIRWPRIRDEVLSKWMHCSDGRLYHPVVAEKAVEAQAAKEAQRARTRAATEAREAKRRAQQIARDEQRDIDRNEQRDDERDAERNAERNAIQGKGREGKGRDIEEKDPPTPKGAGSVHGFPPGFERFWSAYPKKVGKDAAAKAFAKRKFNAEELDAVLQAIEAQKASPGWIKDRGQFIPNPATWLNEGRWQDEVDGDLGRVSLFEGNR